jgi:hypothetical protein
VLSSTILGIRDPLATALEIEAATDGNTADFARFMAAYVGPDKLFVAASVWRVGSGPPRVVTAVGASSAPSPTTAGVRTVIVGALTRPTFTVVSIPTRQPRWVGYAIANSPRATFAVYAERAIPANRRVAAESNVAFADLDYATYLGPVRAADVATTDVPITSLPISGYTARDVIPFGDTTLTLVAAAAGDLGGSFGADLPWIFLIVGAAITLGIAVIAGQLVARRRDAEDDARTITGLYEHLDVLFSEQRTIAETLQRALLPQSNPAIPGMEFATRYVAGTLGVDVGGDWYSVTAIDAHRFAFAVGDVSGRGVSAAAVMARLRFSIEAYLLEGHPPDAVLAMCSDHIDVLTDDHFATVLVGVGDSERHEVTLASAGHPPPLLLADGAASYIDLPVGLPLGIEHASYTSRTLRLEPDATVVAFTDGLVERRGESLETGFARLADAAVIPRSGLDELLTGLIPVLDTGGAEDDLAILGFRWHHGAD